MGVACAHIVLVGIPKWKAQEDNIQMDIKQLSWKGDDYIHLAQVTDKWWTLGNAVMNTVPQNFGNILTSWGIITFSMRPLFHGVG